MFMVSLNSTIVAPAMNIIAADLNGLSSQTWIATAYMVAFNASQPLAAKFSDIFGRKPVILFGCLLFFIGSIVNALAKNMNTLIPGRTVQGFGGGCVMAMAYIIVTDLGPIEMRPRLQACLAVIYGLASVVGPLIGGAFVDKLNWHWDFWLNVILSSISGIILFFLLNEPTKVEGSSFRSKMKRIDWLGSLFTTSFICCLLLALNWGPVYGWGQAHSIGSFVGAGVSLVALIVVEGFFAAEPIMPARVVLKPAVSILYLCGACLGVGFIGTLYFGPVLFQSVFGATSTASGIRLIPYMALLIVASVGGSIVIAKVPYPKLFIVLGAACNLLGYGLFYTVKEHDSWGKQAGYLTLCGFAFGLSQQNLIIAVQALVEKRDLAVATSLNNFFLMLASSVGVAVYQTLLSKFLVVEFAKLTPEALGIAAKYGALKNYLLIRDMPIEAQGPIIHAYWAALNKVFILPMGAGAVGLICSLLVRNYRFGAQKDQASNDNFTELASTRNRDSVAESHPTEKA
ncbi:major facilitator superfamily domain-containing protein [Phycomyces nitens]|nr:major facilitator superfamily domain-containing protein [Phycomyces nitens]